MILFHASKHSMCHKDGITNKKQKTCCRFDDGYVYLASMEYLEEQYFQYCPKGIYYIFQITINKGNVEYLPKVDHYRHRGEICSDIVQPHSIKVVKNGVYQ